MVLNLKDKQAIVAEVKEIAKGALSAVVADSSGVSVNKITELRKECRKVGVYLRIVRNTLMCRVIKDTQYECLKKAFIGPTLIAFSNKNPGTAARLFKEFSRVNPEFEIKAAVFEGEYIPGNQIDRLVAIPTYEEAIVNLMSTMQEAFVGKLIRIMLKLCDKKKNT